MFYQSAIGSGTTAVECKLLGRRAIAVDINPDARKHAHFIPITPRVLQAFLDVGFVLRENIIKLQWKMKGTRENWSGTKYNFLLIGHENLYVFRKLKEDESKTKFKNSMKWR